MNIFNLLFSIVIFLMLNQNFTNEHLKCVFSVSLGDHCMCVFSVSLGDHCMCVLQNKFVFSCTWKPEIDFSWFINVFQGLTKLIDNPLTHPMLKTLLPQMSSCFHDVSEKVRLAFVDMLLKVKTVKAVKVGSVGRGQIFTCQNCNFYICEYKYTI